VPVLRAIDPLVKNLRPMSPRAKPSARRFLESHLLDDLPLGRVHHRDDAFHSDNGLERT
jgi:hypothetical protein